jgi:hypothetical protein
MKKLVFTGLILFPWTIVFAIAAAIHAACH